MSEPIVFISRHKVKEGKLDAFKQFYLEGVKVLEGEKPGTVAQLAYLNEDGTEVAIVHVFPNADAMDLHVEGADERSRRTYEFVQPAAFEVYGSPSDRVLEMFKRAAGSGADLSIRPQQLGGLIRLRPA
jgi:hypothetical protein